MIYMKNSRAREKERSSFSRRLFLYLSLFMFAACMPLFLSTGAEADGTRWYVTQNGGTETKDGTSWATAYGEAEFPAAIQSADAGDELWVAVGVYRPVIPANSRDITTDEEKTTFQLKPEVALYGGFTGNETTRDARDWQNNVTVLTGDLAGDDTNATLNGGVTVSADYILIPNSDTVVIGSGTDDTAVLDGFTICGGDKGTNTLGLAYGGGMYNNDSSPTVRNCTFLGNTAQHGGGMTNYNSSSGPGPRVTNCTFSANAASSAGGGMFNMYSDPRMTDCTFSANTAPGGGGMQNQEGSPIMTNCTFSTNTATGSGIDNGGGGIFNYISNPTITNCTFSANTAVSDGGGMKNHTSSSPTVTNCTFSTNNTAASGRGMMNYSTSNPTVTNCIFWGDTANNVVNEIANDTSTPTVTYCVIQNGTEDATKHIIVDNPKLEALGDNGGSTQTCALGTGSSALDVGLDVGNYTVASNGTITPADNTDTRTTNPDTTFTVPDKDQRGKTRPRGSGVDMGALEMEVTPTAIPTAAPTPTSAPAPDPEPTATPTQAPSGTPVPKISPRPLQGDIEPGTTITPVPNEEDPVVRELKEELDDPESDARKQLENTIQEEVQKALEEKLGREIDLKNLDVNVHTSDAYRFENVPLNKDDGTGTVIVPVVITYENPGEEKVEIFFTLVLVYDLSTNPPTPLEYRMVMLEEGDAVSGEKRDIAFIRAENENEENLMGYLQVRDQSEYDGNPQVGVVSTKYMFLYADGYEGTPAPTGTASGGGSGGCSLGFFPLALLLALPLMLLKK